MSRLAAAVALVLAAAPALEILGHAAFRLETGRFIWAHTQITEVFELSDYVELVDDGRLVTLRPRADAVSCGDPRRARGCWTVRTDENRFRTGENRYDRTRPNVVFLGDSVPFGYGVDGDKSVPSLFYGMLRARGRAAGVINAAVPGYALAQAVARYRAEIAGRYPVRAVVLQIYEPAEEFSLWGRDWNGGSKWTARDLSAIRADRRLPGLLWAYRHSFLINEWRYLDAFLDRDDARDEGQLERFDRVNAAALEELRAETSRAGAELILLPVNPTTPTREYLKQRTWTDLASVIDRLNESLRRFALSRPGAAFLDVSAEFDRLGRAGLFRDRSCHLSERGARLQARLVYDELRRLKIL